jgi:Tfp pilus assembly protein PilN
MLKKRLNFIPRELRPKLEIPLEIIPVSLFVVAVFFMATNAITVHFDTKQTSQKLDTMKVENDQLSREIQVLTEQNKKMDENAETLNTLQKVLSRKNYWSEIFKELSILIPKGIWLTNFTNSGTERIILKGESATPEGVARFLRALEGSQHFSGARMISSEKESEIVPTRYKFELSVPVSITAAGGGT